MRAMPSQDQAPCSHHQLAQEVATLSRKTSPKFSTAETTRELVKAKQGGDAIDTADKLHMVWLCKNWTKSTGTDL